MADIRALLTSNYEHYVSPPEYVTPMRRLLVPRGSGRKLMDPSHNDASIVGAHLTADGIEVDGLTVDRSTADAWHENPPYGSKIKAHTKAMAYWGRERGVPGVGLLPARDDTAWCQEHVFASADAWVHVRGRFTFWRVIPLDAKDAHHLGPKAREYYLRRWYPWATDDNLPAPFRSLAPGFAIGPELGENGKPQSAPFPSLIPFWADPKTLEQDPRDERDALRELVRAAVDAVESGRRASNGLGRDVSRLDEWLAEAECILGSRRFDDRSPLDRSPFDQIVAATQVNPPPKFPISVREFARHFRHLGKLTVARGPHRGVYLP